MDTDTGIGADDGHVVALGIHAVPAHVVPGPTTYRRLVDPS